MAYDRSRRVTWLLVAWSVALVTAAVFHLPESLTLIGFVLFPFGLVELVIPRNAPGTNGLFLLCWFTYAALTFNLVMVSGRRLVPLLLALLCLLLAANAVGCAIMKPASL